MKRICKMCGEEFETTNNAQRYCSDTCRAQWKRESRRMTCPVCGAPFYEANGMKYCSEVCKSFAERKSEDFHSESLDWKAKHWGAYYGRHQSQETLKMVGNVDVTGILTALGKLP